MEQQALSDLEPGAPEKDAAQPSPSAARGQFPRTSISSQNVLRGEGEVQTFSCDTKLGKPVASKPIPQKQLKQFSEQKGIEQRDRRDRRAWNLGKSRTRGWAAVGVTVGDWPSRESPKSSDG